MKKIASVVAMLLMLALSNVWASDWVRLELPGHEAQQSYYESYYDAESISCEGNITKVWVKRFYVNAYEKTGFNEYLDHETYLIGINCADRKFTFLEAHQYRYRCDEKMLVERGMPHPAWAKARSKAYESPVDFSKGLIVYGDPSYTGIGIGVWRRLDETMGRDIAKTPYLFGKVCPCTQTKQEQTRKSPAPVVPPAVAQKPPMQTRTLTELMNEESGLIESHPSVGGGIYTIKVELDPYAKAGKYKRWQDATKMGKTTKTFSEWLLEQYQNFGQEKLRALTREQLTKIENEIRMAEIYESDQKRILEREQAEAQKKEDAAAPKKIPPIPKRIGELPPKTRFVQQNTGWEDGLNQYGMYGMKWGMAPSGFLKLEPEAVLLVPETPIAGMAVYKVKTRSEEDDYYYLKNGTIFAKRMAFTGLRTNYGVDNILKTLKDKYGPYTQTTETIEGLTWTHLQWDAFVGKAVPDSPQIVSIHFRYYISPTEGPSWERRDKQFFPGQKVERLSYGELFYVFHPRSASVQTPQTPAKRQKRK